MRFLRYSVIFLRFIINVSSFWVHDLKSFCRSYNTRLPSLIDSGCFAPFISTSYSQDLHIRTFSFFLFFFFFFLFFFFCLLPFATYTVKHPGLSLPRRTFLSRFKEIVKRKLRKIRLYPDLVPSSGCQENRQCLT